MTKQAEKAVTSSQPQITDSKIYTGNPIAPYAGGARHTRQPPDTKYKIYGAKPVPTVAVRFADSEDGDQVIINEADFDESVHILANV